MRFIVFSIAVAFALYYVLTGSPRGISEGMTQAVCAGKPMLDAARDVVGVVSKGGASAIPSPDCATPSQTVNSAVRQAVSDPAPAVRAPAPVADPVATVRAVAADPAPVPAPAPRREAAPAQQADPFPLIAVDAPRVVPPPQLAGGPVNLLPTVTPEIAQRRAEVLGTQSPPAVTTVRAPEPVFMSPAERRQELTRLAQDMEMFFARKVGN